MLFTSIAKLTPEVSITEMKLGLKSPLFEKTIESSLCSFCFPEYIETELLSIHVC